MNVKTIPVKWMLVALLFLPLTGCISVQEHQTVTKKSYSAPDVGTNVRVYYEVGDTYSDQTGTILSATADWIIIENDDGQEVWISRDKVTSVRILR